LDKKDIYIEIQDKGIYFFPNEENKFLFLPPALGTAL
jgi:hypothetical protein